MSLLATFNHPSGFFAQAEARWHLQRNRGYTPALSGDDFWHFDLFAGYRFARRKAELGVGLLNLADRDYRLHPLNLHAELPRHRTFVARLKCNF
ncbi:MAG: hypothetical protein FJ387_28545 [Verrucomicrobia bacterium]|nr:hypothetical protein [Verrucomicrobiota bacterium]